MIKLIVMGIVLVITIVIHITVGCSYPITYTAELIADPELMEECGVGVIAIEEDN